jgi:DNA-binding NtrC family response regulator
MMASVFPKPTILLVDDEKAILKAMVRVLRREPYRLLTASSPAEAMEILSSNAVDVVVSDERMPETSGTELLGRVRMLYPQTIRIILTGEAQLDVMMNAIREGYLYRFLCKPLASAELVQVLRQAVNLKSVADQRARLPAAGPPANR